ncbi:MAG: ABC transporter ATP-binding protein [Chloroflexi bacterium]|nr:ABC transporter ATP-binding protein [Chloroflexota bacterium]
MSNIVIRAEKLSKLYRMGQFAAYSTLRESLVTAFSAPFRRLRPTTGASSQSQHPDSKHIWALKDVSFEVKQGEAVGIIGRNGAGKSTLLKILCRITEPTEGYAEIRGRVGSLLEVGTGFHPELTGRENIYLNGAVLGMKRKELDRKFDEIVEFSGEMVKDFIDTPLKRYSTGMQVRLAFSVAAHLEPEILLVDEVLAVGDYEFQQKCLGKMEDVAKGGRTVLFVSHNMASIANLCDRAILLDAGKFVMEGSSAEVVQHYIATARGASGEVVWEDPTQAPGNDIVRLHAVRIFQDGIDGPTADVDIAKEVVIQIAYWNLQEGAQLYRAIILKDQMDTMVFASSNHRSVSLTEDPWSGRPHPIGLFQSNCRIPGNFLNEGRYSITAIVGKGVADTQILEDRVVSFRVYDTGEMRKEFHGGWGGVLRPRLAWNTEHIASLTEEKLTGSLK